MSTTANRVDFRRLELRDLNAIEKSRARVVPHAVVALDVRGGAAKAVVDLARGLRSGDHELLGYLIISRYVDAWHVMNLAVAPKHRRKHIAAGLLEQLFVAHRGRGATRLHARGARLERRRDPPVRAGGLQGPRRAARLLHGQSRGRADHVARSRAGAGATPT
jgi:ribosomal protein S18 acetylase RimI-like enzyme